jgi:Zn-dependent peptidase ImmA (M78 family)
MKDAVRLSELEVDEIRKLAEKERQGLGFFAKTPIANDLVTILDDLGIILLELPIKSKGDKQAFSAALMYSEEGGKELVFIGLNTADYFDQQLFAIAHELYHFYTKTASHLSRIEVEEDKVEYKANRFAAEFLMPAVTLKSIVLEEFKTVNLEKVQFNTLIRFIARLQCTWWLPYKSIVRRLKEINAISSVQYTQLYDVNERELTSSHGKVGLAVNAEVFKKLNKSTFNYGTSAKEIEVIIRNFEDGIIDEDVFADTLKLFGKSPDDFGYSIEVEDDDFDAYFNGEDEDES